MLNTSFPIKEIKKNVCVGASDYFMSLGGSAMRGRKMVLLNPDVFPSNEGILFVP